MFRFATFFLSLIMFSAVYGQNEVRLINAVYFDQTGQGDYTFTGFVEVENIAYEKDVEAIYIAEDGTEQSVSASYLETDQRGRERWGFFTDVAGVPESFFIEYTVNQQTYFDDNNGLDYAIEEDNTVYGESDYVELKVLRRHDVGPSCPGCETVSGSIIVENLEYTKQVTLHYYAFNGFDGFINAQYSVSLGNNKELWTFEETFASSRPRVAFFEVLYDVGGVTYGDSNNEVLYGRKPYWLDAYYGNPGQAIGNTIARAQLQSGCDGCRIVTGTVELKNIAYFKDVVVSYVLDSGDVIDMPTDYLSGPGPNGYETWSFQGINTIAETDPQPVSAIVTYAVAGKTYSQSVPIRF